MPFSSTVLTNALLVLISVQSSLVNALPPGHRDGNSALSSGITQTPTLSPITQPGTTGVSDLSQLLD